MPFLPTLAVAAVLAAASLLCPTSQPASPTAATGDRVAPAPGPTAFAPLAAPTRPDRAPATLAFAAVYPLDPEPGIGAAAFAATAPHPAIGPRVTARLAAAGRRPCPGRRCLDPAHIPSPRDPDPLAAGPGAAEVADARIPPLALPFAVVAETLAPAAHAVGQAARLMRTGAASVEGSVAMLAQCLP